MPKQCKLPKHIRAHMRECDKRIIWSNTSLNSSFTSSSITGNIISGSCDKTIKIWDAKSGTCLQTLSGHQHWIECLLYLPRTHQIVSGSCDWTIKIWCVRTGACVRTLIGHNSWINSLLHLTSSNDLASGSWDNTIKIWSLDTGECRRTLVGHRKGITCLMVIMLDDHGDDDDDDDEVANNKQLESKQKQRLISCSRDQTIKLWCLTSGECLITFNGHSNYVTCCLKLTNKKQIVSASADQTLKLWSLNTSKCIKTLYGHTSPITNLLLLSTSSLVTPYDELVSCSSDSEIRVWSLSRGICLKSLQGHVRNISNLLFAWHATNEMVGASCSHNESLIKVWSLPKANSNVSNDSCVKTFKGHTREVKCLTYLNEIAF